MTLRRAIAIHESAHAVAALVLGGRVERVVVNDDTGRVFLGGGLDPVAAAVVTHAGAVARWKADPTSPLSRDDFRMLDHLCGTDSLEAHRRWQAARVQGECLVDAHWPAIEAVARELMWRGEMIGDDVRMIIAHQSIHGR